MKKSTHDEYIKKVAKINPNIEVVGEYINARTKILHRCKIDGYEWMAKPNGILNGYGCPKCGGVARVTNKEHIKRIEDINPNIEVLGEYVNAITKVLYRCKICGNKFEMRPNDIFNGHGCPVCNQRRIGGYPEYINSIWASEYKEYFSKYLTEDQMKPYTPYSQTRIEVCCPDCGRYKEIEIRQLLHSGLGCICSDGISYPNKFMYSILEQLGADFISEYSPSWANKKRYDFYIQSINCIIENNGLQHYKDIKFFKGIKAQRENDLYKYKLAINNGISDYVIIDCRKSNKDFIQESVMNSELPKLLGFNSCDINWDLCNKFATSNLVKTACDLWNNGLTNTQIEQALMVSSSSVSNYLIKGRELNMCNYPIRKHA